MIRESIELLGLRARDRVTGYEGVIETTAFDLYGCVQLAIRPPVNDKGEVPDGRWFDVSRLEIKGDRIMPVPDFDRAGTQPPAYAQGPADKPRR